MRRANPARSHSAHGPLSYIETSREIAERTEGRTYFVLARMLLAKALYGLSAFEYGSYSLHGRPLSVLRQYRTKKQTTALFRTVNPLVHRAKVEDKLLFHQLCQERGLPTPEVLAILSSRGIERSQGILVFPHLPAWLSHISTAARLDVILKPRNDALGTGVRFLSFQAGHHFDLEGRRIDIEAFTESLHHDMQRDDYIVQSFLRPHERIAALGSGKALGTFRILTYLRQHRVHILYALLRIPCAGNVPDNFAGGASGNLVACVNLDTGRLAPAWGRGKQRTSRLLESFDRNPETHTEIRGVLIREWAAICEVAERAAKAFPELPCLGWDIALSTNGIVVIEANSNPDIVAAQVCCDKGARELLRPVLID